MQVHELEPDQEISLGRTATVRAFRVDHAQDRLASVCLGYRFGDADGHAVVYSGDTGPCDTLTAAATGANLLVVECSTPDDLATPGHMTPRAVGDLCGAARPERVVLTHLYPPAAELDLETLVARDFDGEVIQARDGDSFTVGDS